MIGPGRYTVAKPKASQRLNYIYVRYTSVNGPGWTFKTTSIDTTPGKYLPNF